MKSNKTGGSHVELSPNAKRRAAKNLRREEAYWARRSGKVSRRNVYRDEEVIIAAAASIQGPVRVCTLDLLAKLVADQDKTLTPEIIERVIFERLSRRDSPPLVPIGNGSYRLIRGNLPASGDESQEPDIQRRVRIEFVKPWE